MLVNLKELIEFYDVRKEFGRHASSIKGLACEELSIALLHNFLSGQGYPTEILKQRATTSGAWLDAWIMSSNGQTETYYQVEVKCWSFHGYGGGRPLPLEVTDVEYKQHSRDLWQDYWDHQASCFKEERLNKVLKRMDQFNDKQHIVEPIACLWQAANPDGEMTPFFKVPCKAKDFEHVHVFSASAYTRSLLKNDKTVLELNLPDTQKRLEIINGIFLPASSPT